MLGDGRPLRPQSSWWSKAYLRTDSILSVTTDLYSSILRILCGHNMLGTFLCLEARFWDQDPIPFPPDLSLHIDT